MEVFLIHNEWNDLCILENNNIKRQNINTEKGYYYYDNELLVVKWDNWNDLNKFKKFEDYYIDVNITKINSILIFDDILNKNKKYLLIHDNIIQINEFNSKKKRNKYSINEKNYLVIQDNCNYEILDIFYKENNIYYNIKNLHKYIDNNSDNKKSNKNKLKINKINYEIDDCINNKNIYILENNVFYCQEYYNKYIDKEKIYCLDIDINYNKNENLFFNLDIYNHNYLDINNYKIYKNSYIINNKVLLDKYFNINTSINIDFNKKRIVTLSQWGYPPFGGGENWLLNLSKIFNEFKYDVYLICFSNGFNGTNFNKTEVIDLSYVKIIQMEYNLYEIIKILKYINPSIINHQGIKRIEFMKIANVLDTPFISGYCFWNNIIKQTYSNIKILDNKLIEKDNSFEYINKYSYVYAASNFVNDVIEKYFQKKINVIETISLKDDYHIQINNKKNKYVCLLNCHHNKGGFLITDLINDLDIKIPLLFVYTEYDTNLELSEIKNLIDKRNNKNNINLLFEEKQNPKEIYEKTKLMLIPSLCDETFCRVAYESKMNNIPIISTSNGNLKYLLKNYALFIDSNKPDDWIRNIENMYSKINLQKNNSMHIINSYENKIKKDINDILNNSSLCKYKKNDKNIAILAPWADQGLGIQARSYYNSLKNIDYNVHIFSFKPYHGNEFNNFLQHDKKEWDYENIYYSPNFRENIDPFEILNFIHDNHISKLILIEASFEQIFKLMSLLKLINIKIYIVINIECVKISEINNHLLFDKILCNNFNSYFIMNNIFNKNVHYLGFHLEYKFFYTYQKLLFKDLNKFNKIEKRKIKFVCSGGLNSISRKNIDVIFDSFLEILQESSDLNIELNILIQSIECPSNLKIDNPFINKQIKYLSYTENLECIGKNDIFIHCGGQEGLGLGFYEALYLGLPIITLDWSPNNEIVKNNYNGWLLDINVDKVYENTECLINRALINKEGFKKIIKEVINNRENTIHIINNTIQNRFQFIKKNKNLFEKNLDLFLN